MPFAGYENFDACVRSNQDVDDAEAYCAAIKRKVEGSQALSDDETKALEESECEEGYVAIDGECVPITEVDDVPPSALDMSAHRVLATKALSGPIKREELENGSVVYRNMALLAEGVWTDAGSGQPTHYDPQELKIVEDNAVNIAHDSGNEVSEVGHIKPDSWTVEDGKGYADVVLTMDSPASEYADENLKTALESGGEKGFGGPSIEIPADAYELERETGTGYPKLVNGEIHGAGLVMDPASKTTSFEHQVAQQGVAMSDNSQSPMVYTLKDDSMEPAEIREKLNLSDDVDEDTIKELAEAGALSLEDYEDKDEEDEDTEMQEDEEPEEPEEEDEEDKDMQDEAMQAIQEQIDDLWSELDELESQMMGESELEEAKQDLADADTVDSLREKKQELKEANDELEKRLSKLEDQPKEPKSLSDSDGTDWEPAYDSMPSRSSGW